MVRAFKPNTQYTFKYEYKHITLAGLSIKTFYSDGSYTLITGGAVNSFATSIVTTVAGKTVSYLELSYGVATAITYFNIDAILLEANTVATSYEPYKESFLYPEPKTLHRLPNGVCDTIENGNYVQRVKEYTLQASDITSLYTGSYVNIQTVLIKKPLDYISYNSKDATTLDFMLNGYVSSLNFSDVVADIGTCSNAAQFLHYILVAPTGTYADLAAAQTALAGTKTWYQLATPIVTENVTSGIPISYPSGSIILEPALADAGVYTDKMSILQTAFPIASLESIKKINAITGEETPLDMSDVVIASGGLSFTHPSLVSGDVVFFTYFYAETGCYGSNSFSYYDSRYVIEDSANSKFYKWGITSASGTPTVALTEVV